MQAIKKVAIAALLSSTVLGATSAYAAEPAAAAAPEEGAAIIVTGTRTTGLKAGDSPAPVQVLSSDLMARAGRSDINTALALSVPSIQIQTFGNDMTAFHPSVKLRGLNPNHTLVMINGKRRHGTANVVVTNAMWTGAAAPDMGLIPMEAVEHVEVLQDGAAAQYGTDAVAGVVNLILKKKDKGGYISGSVGQYYAGDGFNYELAGNIGMAPVENMYLNLTVQHKVKDYSFRGDVDPRVVSGTTQGATLLSRFPGLTSAANYPYVNRIFGDGRMALTNMFYNMGYTGIQDIEIYSFGSYSTRTGSTYQNYRLPNVVYGQSAVVAPSSGVATGDIPFPTGFSPLEALKETDFAWTGGIKGTFGKSTVDLSATYGKDINKVYVVNSANAALYYDSSTTTRAGYTPRDVFDGSFTASQFTVNLDGTHELEVGLSEPVHLAAGGEWRRDTYALGAGEVASYYVGTGKLGGGIQSFFGYSPANASNNSRTNFSQYFDISLKPVEKWLVDGAVRHENYSDFGDTTVFKLTSRYDFSPAIAVRGTISTGFRAPTLAEGFYSGINVGPASLSGIFAPNSAGAKALGISGLKPEKSTNLSFGLVLNPLPKLTITIDAYSIYLRDRIVQSSGFLGYSNNCKYLPGGYSPSTDLNAALSAAGCSSNVIVSPSVLTALYNNGVPITSIIDTINGGQSGSLTINSFVNGLSTLTRGVDFLATYNTHAVGGRVDFSLSANYNETSIKAINAPPSNINSRQGIFDKYSQSALTDTTPKWRATFNTYWESGKVSINLRESVYGPAKLLAQTAQTAEDYYQRVGTKFVTDLEATYAFTRDIKFSVGANNLFGIYPDKIPAFARQQQFNVASTAYVSQYPSFSSVGINGGYYYAKLGVKF
ncbi:iron complex outermembrane receptor protein [Novosphingobium sp. SG751A]|uniref:TonB-dependent receptor plug domain-containing protein n=1 Tax=Novosphingobium sp. SG751A TaxID=2587000 RepID=UPI001551C858|nr:TonB-dependent receptor [Novosphingobium sp. SG751A]NOW47544.1 iron complex outermembrane receptor protein [Novosphingobium sp. SG751A]